MDIDCKTVTLGLTSKYKPTGGYYLYKSIVTAVRVEHYYLYRKLVENGSDDKNIFNRSLVDICLGNKQILYKDLGQIIFILFIYLEAATIHIGPYRSFAVARYIYVPT